MTIGVVHSSLATIQGGAQAAGSPRSEQLATSQSSPPAATAAPADSGSPGDAQRAAAELIASRSNDPLRPDRLQPGANRTASAGASRPSSSPSSQAASSQTDSSSSTPLLSPPAPAPSLQPAQVDPQQQAQLRELAQIDREVRDHEAAHAAAGGGLAGAPSYSYTRGPDGQLYATGGEVSIDTSTSVDPKDAAQNARTVLQAALAPANPSTQDLRVAAQARAQLIDAQAELTRNEQQAVEAQRAAKAEPSGVAAEPESVLSQALKAEKEAEAEKKEAAKANEQQPRDDDDGSAFQDSLSALQAREARIRQSQLDFAEELSALNQRIQQVQQQLIATGEVDPASLLQGFLLDTQA